MSTVAAEVAGPLHGGRGWPFGMPDAAEVADHGYVMEEFLARGTATRLEPEPGSTDGPDGMWVTRQVDPAAFATRFVVIRPADPRDFNGVVVANWQNVTTGVDLGAPTGNEIWRGYAWVGVTCQEVALTGVVQVHVNGQFIELHTTGLREWDPQRYGKLQHPGDGYSYSIYTSVARALGRDRPRRPVDPLGGLEPDLVIATGGSQSAARLGSYINGAHQHEKFFDAFELVTHWGAVMPLNEAEMYNVEVSAEGDIVGNCRIRTDQPVPVFVVNSETETWSVCPVRQPDTATFRFWEIAGGCHGGGYGVEVTQARMDRDGIQLPMPLDLGVEGRNTLDWSCVEGAALRHLVRWAKEGIAPPSFPPIEMKYGDPLTSVVRDDLGVAVGGVRLPEIDVPVAVQMGVNSTPNMLLKLIGERRPLTAEQLAKTYGSDAEYERRYRRALAAAVQAGVVLPEDVGDLEKRGHQLALDAGLTAGASP